MNVLALPDPNDSNRFEFEWEGHRIRGVMIDGDPWFVAADICAALKIKDVSDAVGRVNEKDRDSAPTLTPGGLQQMLIVNESGFYDLVLDSRMPQAKALRHKVTSEVLPAIRKTGFYGRELSRLELIEMALIAEKERLAATTRVNVLVEQLVEIGPEAGAWRELAASKDDWLLLEVAKILNRDDAIKTGPGRLWRLLDEWGILTKKLDRNLPRQEYIDGGLFNVKIATFHDPHTGAERGKPQLRVTYEGIVWLHQKLGGTSPIEDLFKDE